MCIRRLSSCYVERGIRVEVRLALLHTRPDAIGATIVWNIGGCAYSSSCVDDEVFGVFDSFCQILETKHSLVILLAESGR